MLDALRLLLASPLHPERPRARAKVPTIPARVLTVLLAEDNRINTMFIKRLVERFGHRVVHAESGVQAVSLWQDLAVDLILMDVQMPEMDGYEATRRIRSLEVDQGRSVPIVALTASAMKGADRPCLEAGMNAYLPKPLDVARLEQILNSVAAGQTDFFQPLPEAPAQ
jgi:CheY-like chemotaxis protein